MASGDSPRFKKCIRSRRSLMKELTTFLGTALYVPFTARGVLLAPKENGGLVMTSNKILALLLMTILLCTTRAKGQSTFGGIIGVVKDPSQSAVAGAQLTLTSLDDHPERKAGTDGNGGFE